MPPHRSPRPRVAARAAACLSHGALALALVATAARAGDPPPLSGFTAPSAHPAGAVNAGAGALATAEATGDPHVDLVVARADIDALAVLANDGAGGFAPAVFHALAPRSRPTAVVGGQFAGGASVAVVEAGAHRVRWFAPGGPRGAALLPAGTSGGVFAAAGDVDGDGIDDVLVALEGELFAPTGGVALVQSSGVVELLPAPPDGFARVVRVALADVDGDGDRDALALRKHASYSTAPEAALVWANTSGAFAFAGALAVGDPLTALLAADIDGDGAAEIVLARDAFPGPGAADLLVLHHDGGPSLAPGAFTGHAVPTGTSWPSALAAGDLGDDGLVGFVSDVDLVVLGFGSLDVELHDGYDADAAAFGAVGAATLGGVPVALALSHLDGDGALDLAVLDGASGDVLVLRSVPAPLAQIVGTGCSGGIDIPAIGITGTPQLGGAFTVTLAHARPSAPAFLALAPALSPLPIGFGCTLYGGPLLPLLPTATTASGSASVPFAVPNSLVPFSGLDLVFQFAVLDPFGAFFGTYSLSDALRVQLGS